MCDHVIRGNTLEEKLHDLKMLSLSSDPLTDGTLDRHDSIWKPWTWFNGSEKVAPETPNQPDTTADPTITADLVQLESTIKSQSETIADLRRKLIASNNRTLEQSEQLRKANKDIIEQKKQLVEALKLHLQNSQEIQRLTEELRKHDISLLDEETPKEEFKKFTEIIVLSPDHSYAMNIKSDMPISQGVRDLNQISEHSPAHVYGKNLERHNTVQDLLTAFNVSHQYSDVLNSNWQKIDGTAPIQTIIIKEKDGR